MGGAEERGRQGPARPPPRQLREASLRRVALSVVLDWLAGCLHGPYWPKQMPSRRRRVGVQGSPSGRTPSRAGGEASPLPLVPCFCSPPPGQAGFGVQSNTALAWREGRRGSPISSNTFPSRRVFPEPCPTLLRSRCLVKCFPLRFVTEETRVRCLGWEDPLEKEMATPLCSCLENPRTEEPGGLQSMGSQSRTRLRDLARTPRTVGGAVAGGVGAGEDPLHPCPSSGYRPPGHLGCDSAQPRPGSWP